jgi:diguanylate cyclase (GGDEF)-like protein/PAS domain S-box-containing protein
LTLIGITGEEVKGLIVPVSLLITCLVWQVLTCSSAIDRPSAEERKSVGRVARDALRFREAFTRSAIATAIIRNDLTIVAVNEALSGLLGYPKEVCVGTEISLFAKESSRELLRSNIGQALEEELSGELLHEWVARDGSVVFGKAYLQPFFDVELDHLCLIVQIQDITAHRLTEAKLRYIAFHDELTGLPNRFRFLQLLKLAIARTSNDSPADFALMYIDFDAFKLVNDSYGHKAGDQLLRTIAIRLKRVLKHDDVIARIGGDEFAVIVAKVHVESSVLDIAERLLACFKSPVRLGESEVTTSASIGISFKGAKNESPDEALREADAAMYYAKRLGKARYAVFDQALKERFANEVRLQSELRHAIANRELYVQYQPIFKLSERVVVGFEALARWRSPTRGIVGPDVFIPISEEIGFIGQIGHWMLNEACRQVSAWQREGSCDETLCMHVNVSGLQLQRPDFVSSVTDTLSRHHLLPQQLILEATESVLMEGESVISNMYRLAELGIRIAMDDFGTGYSSLSCLHKLPITFLKIDQSFVARLSSGDEAVSVVQAIISLGLSLKKCVVAEGVESQFQIEKLTAMGCSEGQGFFFSSPLGPGQAQHVLDRTLCLRKENVQANARSVLV